MADLQVKTANICNITSGTTLYPNAGGSGTYIADNSISVHMVSGPAASGIYILSLPEISVIGDEYTISFIPICAANTTLLIELAGVQKSITFTSGIRKSVTVEARAANRNLAFYGGDGVEKTVIIKDIQIEKGDTATVYRPYSATGWVHSLRKLTTATDTITTLPADLYADGTNATVGLKGNMSQTGTPTPDNPIQPQETGERTGNLAYGRIEGANIASNGTIVRDDRYDVAIGRVELGVVYTVNSYVDAFYTNESITIGSVSYDGSRIVGIAGIPTTFTAPITGYVAFRVSSGEQAMLNTGSTPLPYEPYGYKLTISSANTTTPVYLGEVQSTRKIKKLVLTGQETFYKNAPSNPNNYLYYQIGYLANKYCLCTHLANMETISTSKVGVFNGNTVLYLNFGSAIMNAQPSGNTVEGLKEYLAAQYANGTPVTVWYVLATETTGIVNEPIRKIGDYADTISGITIPTITGKDTFDVQTTLKPSEVSLSYTGWRDTTVKEKSENLFDSSKESKNTYISIYNNTGTSTVTNTSDYIKINSSTLVLSGIRTTALQNASDRACCFYDANKTLIDGVLNPADISTPCVITVPQNTAYIRFAYDKSFEGAVMLNEGSVAIPYESYWK